jgi:aldehyde dehydrogenase
VGEVCFAGTRVFVHRSVYDEFVDQVQQRVSQVKQGDPTDPQTTLGAQSSRTQYDKVLGYIDLGKSEGAEILTGGKPAHVDGLRNGLFIEPTFFTNVRNDMKIAQEEIFGPVTDILAWDDESDMITQVNDSI